MPFFCINCKSSIEPAFKACPFCGEPITDFLRKHLEEPIDGKYQIISRLGVGGMGEVYKVLHIHLNSIRVVKLMRPAIATEENAHERFIREARLATKIHHPNVATLFDFSTLADGSYYMVWEFIEGTNLAEVIRAKGCLSPRYAARLSAQALMGLDAIHKVGIVHRDISPENLMITRDEDGEERVKIIDLGIAKQWGDTSEDKTKTGMFVGKWKYCSPEHLGMLKKGERIDGRADIYSYGIVMYEMLAGAPPFLADTPHRYLMMHASENPKPFHELDPQTNIPAELEAQLFKALEKDRDKRFTTAREFSRSLEALIPSLPDEARLPTVAPYSDEPTAERPLSSGTPDSMKSTIAKKKSITEETPLPSEEEQREAYHRLTHQAKLPKPSASSAELTPTVQNQELVPTVAGGAQPKVASPDDVTRMDAVKPLIRTVELEPLPEVSGTASAAGAESGSRSKTLLRIALAAAAAVIVAIGGYFLTRTPPKAVPATATTTATAVAVSGTSGGSVTVAAPGHIGLYAYPWGEIKSVKNLATGAAVPVSETIVTPGSLELPPGRYELTMANPAFPKPLTQTVEVAGGETKVVSFLFKKASEADYPDFGGTL